MLLANGVKPWVGLHVYPRNPPSEWSLFSKKVHNCAPEWIVLAVKIFIVDGGDIKSFLLDDNGLPFIEVSIPDSMGGTIGAITISPFDLTTEETGSNLLSNKFDSIDIGGRTTLGSGVPIMAYRKWFLHHWYGSRAYTKEAERLVDKLNRGFLVLGHVYLESIGHLLVTDVDNELLVPRCFAQWMVF